MICLNEQELGFTTSLGKHWKVWQAVREIYCNTTDENGRSAAGEVVPTDDTTTVQVRLSEFAECYRNIGKYILQTSPFAKTGEIEFHARPSGSVFYRSIMVVEAWDNKPFKFTPNVIEKIDLTEDRTAKDHWQVKAKLAQAIVCCEDEKFIEKWLTAGPDFAEHVVDLDWPFSPSQAFLRVASDLARDTSRPLNLTALRVLAKHLPPPEPIEAELIDMEADALRKGIEFCKRLKYNVDEYRIIVVESLGESILGQANVDMRHIYLARRAILMGDMTLAATLIEEWAHIKHGFKDCERNMQNWLFEQLTRIGAAFLYEQERNH